MTKFTDKSNLETWLQDKPPAFACVLAIRAALRVAPLLDESLREDETERRATIVLPSFRALATAEFVSTWPARATEIRNATRGVRKVSDTVSNTFNNLQISLVDYMEIGENPFSVKEDIRALNVAACSVDAAVYAVQANFELIDAANGIASPVAVIDAAASSVMAAIDAVDRAYGYSATLCVSEIEDDIEVDGAAQIADLWKAVELDIDFLSEGRGKMTESIDLATNLSSKKLWLNGIPVWAGRRWGTFTEELPESEGWQVWRDWYEDRLRGKTPDEELEFARVTVSTEDWEQGPAHVNTIIKNRIKVLTEDLYEQDSLMNNTPHSNMREVRDALYSDQNIDENDDGTEIEKIDPKLEVIEEPFNPENVVVSTQSTTINLILSRIDNYEIDLAPDFQRKTGIWNIGAKSRLIESLLLRIPIPVFYVAADDEENWAVVDGIQRLSTIYDFVNGEFKLTKLQYLHQFDGFECKELPRKFIRRIHETELIINIIDERTPEEVKFNIFLRINTGGKSLNTQEIRHALHPGTVRTFLKDLANSKEFLDATNHSISDSRMADRECVLRFLAFYLRGWENYGT